METLEVNGNTKISELIKWNRNSVEAIARLSRPLEKLRNPILRKLMASRVTIAEAARMGGCDVADFERVLKPLGFIMTRERGERTIDEETPAWFNELPETSIRIFDVREILANGEDPLKEILKKFKAISSDEALCIINKFIPVPLIRLLEKDRVLTFTRTVSVDEHYTYFYKSTGGESNATGGASDADVDRNAIVGYEKTDSEKMKMVDEQEFDEVCARFEKVKEIDVRDLQAPGPMETILGILPDLEAGELLYVNHKRVPLYLLEEIADDDYQVYISNREEGDVKLAIYRI